MTNAMPTLGEPDWLFSVIIDQVLLMLIAMRIDSFGIFTGFYHISGDFDE